MVKIIKSKNLQSDVIHVIQPHSCLQCYNIKRNKIKNSKVFYYTCKTLGSQVTDSVYATNTCKLFKQKSK